ncbi:c-di-GMP-specific phosphodiesterase [Escherichia coli]|nr:c-di-GMP-specific phosphodiesterase [Escherichia coli]GDO70014.1 c-di-GMP-specific phosphodiesterase [Escherichia coli]
MLQRGFRLAVNVTPTLLLEHEFTQMCLALAGHDSILLVLELTKQQPFNMDRQTERILSRLSDAGVAFAMDYFGAGCSVLSYLKRFPVSYIKMDKSFTQDILSENTSRYIVESVVGLAGKPGIDTVAEGVETQAQVNCLCSLGVDNLQGGGRKPEKAVVINQYFNSRKQNKRCPF